MKILNGADPTATLASERAPIVRIDLQGCTILCRNDSAVYMEYGAPPIQLCNAFVFGCKSSSNRLQRFWAFTKAAWRASK